MSIFTKLKQYRTSYSNARVTFGERKIPMPGEERLTLEMKIILLVCLVVASSLLTTFILISNRVYEIAEEIMGKNATRIAQVVAQSPDIIESLASKKKSHEIENWTILLGNVTKANFIIYDTQGEARYRSSTQQPAVDGRLKKDEEMNSETGEYVYVQQLSKEDFLHATSPIFGPNGSLVGTVVVGVSRDSASEARGESRSIVIYASFLGLLLGMLGAFLLAKNIKDTLFGLEPFAIARLLEERDAMLQSVREGIVAIDTGGNITLVNDEALRLIDMAGNRKNLLNHRIDSVIPNTKLLDVIKSKIAEYDQEETLNGNAVVMNRVPIFVEKQAVAAIATFRDLSEVRLMAEELTGVKIYVEALRSQTHDFMNKLHVILGMVRLKAYDELSDYIARISSDQEEETDFVVQRIKDPVLAGFWIGKLSRARELGVYLRLQADSSVPNIDDIDFTNDLVTVIGNLVDNAMEAIQNSASKKVVVTLSYGEDRFGVEVQDTGPGVPHELQDVVFEKGFSTKGANRGFGLALIKKVIERRGGTISMESNSEQGTIFHVEIPMARRK